MRRLLELLVVELTPHAFELALQHLAPQRDAVGVAALSQPVADLAARGGGADDLEPVLVGLGLSGGDDLDRVAVAQLVAERHQLAVDARPHGVLAHLGVDQEGEVERRGSLGQPLELAPRGVGEHLLLVEGGAQEIHVLVVAGGALPVHRLGHEVAELGVQLLVDPAALLVDVVGRHPGLGGAVHLAGADLDFHHLALGGEDGGVERLVEVALGSGDVVLEALRGRDEQVVDHPERPVTVVAGVGDDAQAEQVVDRLEVAPRAHLVVDRVEVLGPPRDLGLDSGGAEAVPEPQAHAGQELLALLAPHLHAPGQVLVGAGIERFETQVLELALDARDPQAVGERRVDLAGLGGDALHLLGAQELDGAHVVDAIGELDEDHPEVARHRQQHLAEVLGLRGLAAVEVQAGELGDSLDQSRHLAAEVLLDLLQGDGRVLDHVVEQGRAGDRGVEAAL